MFVKRRNKSLVRDLLFTSSTVSGSMGLAFGKFFSSLRLNYCLSKHLNIINQICWQFNPTPLRGEFFNGNLAVH